ncbi:hypothetical protein [Streptomyces sp. DSM 15324]|uniref:hypothetical protein n=1 Tax=Streptomyces sp. DSM 15324 TaxID=1739111 RepID=UPI00074732A3|nr:hypothetical protein [Streptomyces sp. DSM 15324]KUO13909.1 hypothetical protein AQJ58_02230 [Streptomyces sp. DSM 15324]
MDLQKPPAEPRQPEGCLVVAIRLPVRIVVLVLVVPVRMAWDALVVTGRFLRDTLLRPLGRALLRLGKVLVIAPAVALHRYVLTPLGQAARWLAEGVAAGLARLYARVLTPVGHAVVWLVRYGIVLPVLWTVRYAVVVPVRWLVRYLVVVPARWAYAWILAPVGRAAAWCAVGLWRLLGLLVTGLGTAVYWIARVLLVLPALALWRWVLVPVGRFLGVLAREVGDALGHAWRIAGHLSRAVGRFLATLFRWVVVEPVRLVYRTVLTPVGHAVRDAVLKPAAQAARAVGRATRQALASARETARQTRADVRRLLFGESREGAVRTREREAVLRREPSPLGTRTLDSSTTALTNLTKD